MFYKEIGDIVYIETGQIKKEDPSAIADVTFPFMTDFSVVRQRIVIRSSEGDKCIVYLLNYICLFNYLFISSQMSAKPYFIGSTGILPLW